MSRLIPSSAPRSPLAAARRWAPPLRSFVAATVLAAAGIPSPAFAETPPGESATATGRPTLPPSEVDASRRDWPQRAQEAEANGDARGDARAAAQAWIRASDTQAAIGDYGRAVETLDHALAAMRTAAVDPAILAALHGARGNLFIVVASPDEARAELEAADRLARQAGARATQATIANNLGNLFARQGDAAEAVARYQASAELALSLGDSGLAARAVANAARAEVEAGAVEPANTQLLRARGLIEALPANREKAALLIHWSRSLTKLVAAGHAAPIDAAAPSLAAHATLLQAEAIATEQDDPRSVSYAWGYLAELYETEGRHLEALELTRRAIVRAREADAEEIRYAWHAQAARLLAKLDRRDEAIGEYAEAVTLLEGMRQKLGVRYGARRETFRDSVGSIYFGYVDLLLRRAADREDHGPDLALAQAALEQLKAAELRDYFRDECVDEARRSQVAVAQVSDSAAILYPVLLDDRIEVLVTTAQRTWRTAVPIPRAEATETIRRLRRLLEKRTTRQFLRPARTLYDWLIEPARRQLEAMGIDALVFVPDGALRTVPMAALHDGEKFLIERFAIAVTPSLELTDPKPLDRATSKAFAGGLSEGVQGHIALPHVKQELSSVGAAFDGEIVIDEEFRRARIEQELGRSAFNIVHIASHASFDPDAEATYVLTHDGRLSMDDLASYVGLFRFREQPLELLMLSACESAAGDDRAALGLSGLAIKAGARSAVGTLWSVNDDAASQLVGQFYANLTDPALTRAEALRRAQRALIEDPRFAHPVYWSAFILISNWL